VATLTCSLNPQVPCRSGCMLERLARSWSVNQWPAMTEPSVDSASMANSWDNTADWSKSRQMQGRRAGGDKCGPEDGPVGAGYEPDLVWGSQLNVSNQRDLVYLQ
jgi:hypothetical protein